jgi:3-hydroxyacyl-[acyl-carrier-protein] dehydratase
MKSLNIHEILKLLPHRYPFLLVDRVLEMEEGKYLKAIKNVSFNEPYFTGHFPDKPVMPGVLILEALAQACCILAYLTNQGTPDDGYLYYFAGIDNVRFKRVVEPGDQLQLRVDFIRAKQDVWKCTGIASVDDNLVCSAEMMSARRKIEP